MEAKTQRWKEFNGAMEQDFWLVPKRNLTHTVYSGGGELLSLVGVIVGWWKEYFKDVLNPANTCSIGEAVSGEELAGFKVTKTVK